MVEQDTLEKFRQAGADPDRKAAFAREGEERFGILGAEAEPFTGLGMAARISADQDEIAIVRDKHEAVAGEVAFDLLAAKLERKVGRDVVDLDDATLGGAAVRPFIEGRSPIGHEEVHVGKAGAAV